MSIYHKILPGLSLLIFTTLHGQSFPLYSQYILNEYMVNPSMTGVDGMTSANISGRQQWFGLTRSFQYAPQTFSASIATRMLKTPGSTRPGRQRRSFFANPSGRVALGASAFSDINGPITKTGIQLIYAYHIPLRNNQLSFGVAGLGYQFKINGENLVFDPADSSAVPTNVASLLDKPHYIPDAAAGITFSTNKLHIGASAYQLLEANVKLTSSSFELKQHRYYFLHSTYQHHIKRKFIIEPSFVFRTNELLNTVSDISVRVIYLRNYWAGMAFRTTGDFVINAGVKINHTYLGYSIDYGFNRITRASYGSHEVILAFKFGDSTRRYKWWERY